MAKVVKLDTSKSIIIYLMSESFSSKQRIKQVLAHRQADKLALDFGASPVTGIHVRVIEKLRRYFGLPDIPVKVTEPYQMLGEVDSELSEILGIDVVEIISGLDPISHPVIDGGVLNVLKLVVHVILVLELVAEILDFRVGLSSSKLTGEL